VRIEGDLPQATRDLIDRSSALITQKGRPPASYAALSRRVDDDVGRFKDVLASEGYYEPDIKAGIDAGVEPAQVVVHIDPGPLFCLDTIEVHYHPAEPATTVPITPADFGLSIGQAAAGAPLVQAERRLVRLLNENGYPNARIVGSRYLADRDTETLSATWTVDTGPLARFGALQVAGLKDVSSEYVQRIADWKPGTLYDIREIERVRTTLAKTRLFATISPPPSENVPVEDGVVPVTFEVSEGPPRSVGVGVYYSTDERGPGGAVSWEHRNLFGSAESLRIKAEGSRVQQSAEIEFRKPAFLELHQSILANLRFDRNDTDAYEGITGSGFAGIERGFLEHWSITAGPALIYANIQRSAGTDEGEQFLLGGARTRLAYDSRDDKLNPTKGLNGGIGLSPFASIALTRTHRRGHVGRLSGRSRKRPCCPRGAHARRQHLRCVTLVCAGERAFLCWWRWFGARLQVSIDRAAGQQQRSSRWALRDGGQYRSAHQDHRTIRGCSVHRRRPGLRCGIPPAGERRSSMGGGPWITIL
jgi:translocation and assembly module TamA